MEQNKEKAVLVAADFGEWDCERSVEELKALCDTDDVEVGAVVVQNMEKRVVL